MNYVLNGLQRDKPFLNVHYLKGFFFLRYLCDKVGDSNFQIFIKNYVSKFSGHLVTSDKFADHFFSFFQSISESKSKLLSDWLQKPGINDELKQTFGQFENSLSKAHCEFWLNFNRKPKTIRNHQSIPELEQLVYPEHLQLFCEYLLETQQRLCKTTMLSIDQTYNLSHQNCEVCHAWCELIIKHDHRPGASCVKKFLVEAQAMGIYLYGELMINGTKFWQDLARSTYASLKDSMEENTRLNIEEMLNPQ
jgi:aminopeptidase O